MSPTHEELLAALSLYPQSLSLRAKMSKQSKDLVALDSWVRNNLAPDLRIQQRGLTTQELGKLMEWKLAVRTPHSEL